MAEEDDLIVPADNNYWGTNRFNNEYQYYGKAYSIVPEDNRLATEIEYQGPKRDFSYNGPTADTLNFVREVPLPDDAKLTTYGRNITYSTYAGTDIVAEFVFPDETMTVGELQTISYSTHRENVPVRLLGHVAPVGFVKGPRTIAGSLIFTVFNYYAFYRLKAMRDLMDRCGVFALSDMLPPFDIVLTFANESGAQSKMRILGVQIIDEGGTMSIDDLVTEQTYSFMARGIQPMTGYKVIEVLPDGNEG